MSSSPAAGLTLGGFGNGNDQYTKLLLHCQGADASTTFTDYSAAAHGNATVHGNAQIDTAQFKYGGASGLCDGTGDWIDYASSADWNLGGTGGGNDFTIDGWYRFNTLPANSGLFATNDGVNAGYQCYFIAGTTKLTIFANPTTASLTWTPSTATWYHVALVRSGTTITAYIDGASIGTMADSDFNNDSTALTIGAFNTAGGGPLDGWFDEFRISKGIARWTANFTPSGQPYL